MPTPYIQSLSKKMNRTIASLEKDWDKAKSIAKDQDQENNYGLITNIFKKIVGVKEGVQVNKLKSLIESIKLKEEISPEEVEAGKRIEAEHKPTYDKIKSYYAENNKFPPEEMVYNWIRSDHNVEFENYYLGGLIPMEKILKAGGKVGQD